MVIFANLGEAIHIYVTKWLLGGLHQIIGSDQLDFEDIFVLLVRQTRLLKPCEEEKVWQQHEGHEYEVLSGAQAVVDYGHLADGLKNVSQTRASTKRADQFLGYRFDVAHNRRFTDGARSLENDGSKAGARDSKVFCRVDHCTGQQSIG